MYQPITPDAEAIIAELRSLHHEQYVANQRLDNLANWMSAIRKDLGELTKHLQRQSASTNVCVREVAAAARALTREFERLRQAAEARPELTTRETRCVELSTPLAELGLSNRTVNALRDNARASTLGDLLRLGEEQLYEVKCLGKKSRSEVLVMLDELGLRLNQE